MKFTQVFLASYLILHFQWTVFTSVVTSSNDPINERAHILSFEYKKVKVVPYTIVRRGVPVREDTYAEPSAYEVGWSVLFLAAFIFPVLPPGTHLLLGEQWASVQSGHRVGLEP